MAVSQEALTILLPLYMLDMGASPAFAALVVGLRGIGVLLFDVPAGMLVARFGDKPVLLGGLTLIFTGLTLLSVTTQPWLVGFAALALGSGHAAWMLGRQSYLADVCTTNELGRAIAAMAGLQRGGALIGPVAGGALAGFAGYPVAFAVGVASAVVAGATVLAFARAVPPHPNPDASLAGTVQVLRDQRRVLATAGGSALVLQLMRATRQLLVPLFGQAVGLDVTTIGLVYSLSTVVDIALFYPSGVLADRLGRKWSAVPSMALYALGLALLPLAAGFYSLLAVGRAARFRERHRHGRRDDHRRRSRARERPPWSVLGALAPDRRRRHQRRAAVGRHDRRAPRGSPPRASTVAGLGVGGALVMAFAVVETLRERPL